MSLMEEPHGWLALNSVMVRADLWFARACIQSLPSCKSTDIPSWVHDDIFSLKLASWQRWGQPTPSLSSLSLHFFSWYICWYSIVPKVQLHPRTTSMKLHHSCHEYYKEKCMWPSCLRPFSLLFLGNNISWLR